MTYNNKQYRGLIIVLTSTFIFMLYLLYVISNDSKSIEFTTINNDLSNNDTINNAHIDTNTQHIPQEQKAKVSNIKRPDYPALVLQGPPKCGTRTFVDTLSRYNDVIQYASERDFWAGANEWRCTVHYNKTQWISFVNNFAIHKAKLQQLAITITTEKRFTRGLCYPDRYRWHWNKIPYGIGATGQHWINKSCQHPNQSITINSQYKRYCYLIEKGPVYARAPWVGIVYTYLMPRIKLLTIVRNPLKQIISSIFAFSELGFGNQFRENVNTTYKILITQFQIDKIFVKLSDMCSKLNKKWDILKLEGKNGRNRYLMMIDEYRNYLVTYYRYRFVYKMFLVEPRREIYKWASFLFPTVLSTLFAWDESKGFEFMKNKWNPLQHDEYYENKYVQFEWMFDNVADAMKIVKCWIMDIKSDSKCDMVINKKDNDLLFRDVEQTNSNRPSGYKAKNVFYESHMQKIWNPCNLAVQHIIKYDRPKLLLGGWYNWNYTYV
eukprot:470429_1